MTYTPHPLRFQQRRARGWKKPVGGIIASQPSKWGNPFLVSSCMEAGYARTKDEARIAVVSAFDSWLLAGDLSEFWFEHSRARWTWMREHLFELRGKRIGCFCALDTPCHADVLAAYANGDDYVLIALQEYILNHKRRNRQHVQAAEAH